MAEQSEFKVRVLTQEKVHLETEAVHLEAPGGLGYLGVLANHAPLVTSLKPGKLVVSIADGDDQVFAVSGGLLKVADNQAVVLADAVERPQEIDLDRAVKAKERAEARLKDRSADQARAAVALERALNRIRIHRAFARSR